MDVDNDFVFRRLFNIAPANLPEDSAFVAKSAAPPDPLGPLAQLCGSWKGTGLNTIWRPLFDPQQPQQKHFLELNLTVEQIDFTEIRGQIPNHGLLQGDLFMVGLHYLQQVSGNHRNGLDLLPIFRPLIS